MKFLGTNYHVHYGYLILRVLDCIVTVLFGVYLVLRLFELVSCCVGVGVSVVCVLIFTVFLYCLYCFCIVSFMCIYSYLFCLYWCKDCWHKVKTELQ